jgi:hypothetical protein
MLSSTTLLARTKLHSNTEQKVQGAKKAWRQKGLKAKKGNFLTWRVILISKAVQPKLSCSPKLDISEIFTIFALLSLNLVKMLTSEVDIAA